MSFFFWLRNRTSIPSLRGRAQHRPAAPRFQPRLEALEDRWVPSTLTVTSAADSGAGSLRADIAAAHSGDTINFAPRLDGHTITLTSGELVIPKSLSIQGPGAGQLAISGGNHWRVFDVLGAPAKVTLSGLTITHGNSYISRFSDYGGGGILDMSDSDGMLTISDCVLSDNYAAATRGGGISIVNGGRVQIVNSTLSGNGAQEGGGVFSAPLISPFNPVGAVAIENCTLSGNIAGYEGGGIWTGSTTMTVNGCTLSGNIEAFDNGLVGDDIYSTGDPGVAATLTISDSVFGFISGNGQAIAGPWIDGGGNTFE